MPYLDNLTPQQRETMLTPSRHLLQYQAFAAAYRKLHPNASGNAVQHLT